jgi:hypothetical protein
MMLALLPSCRINASRTDHVAKTEFLLESLYLQWISGPVAAIDRNWLDELRTDMHAGQVSALDIAVVEQGPVFALI